MKSTHDKEFDVSLCTSCTRCALCAAVGSASDVLDFITWPHVYSAKVAGWQRHPVATVDIAWTELIKFGRGYEARRNEMQMYDAGRVKLVPRAGVEPARPFGQRILSPLTPSAPSLTTHDKPIFIGICSRQSQLHSVKFDMRSRHLHVIRLTEFHPLGMADEHHHVTFSHDR